MTSDFGVTAGHVEYSNRRFDFDTRHMVMIEVYNKLNTGAISLTKSTEDGKNLSGWQFGIYSNSACTTLVSGPHSTNTSGKISVTGLTPGTYYVKELGHTDSAINALYYCSSTNPQAVTVTAGGTATVSFTNKLNTGSVPPLSLHLFRIFAA